MNNIYTIILALVVLASCGKPTDPESLKTYESAGYKLVSRFEITGFAQDVVVDGNMAYIAQGEGGLLIADISDPENPVFMSSTSEGVRGYSNKIIKKENTIFLAAGSFGLNVLDVTDPNFPVVEIENLGIKPAKNFHIMGDYLITAISEQGINVSNISNPNLPEIRADTKTIGYSRGTATTSDSLYLLVACGEMGLAKHNISHFQDGYGTYPLVGFGNTPGYAEDLVLDSEKNLAYVACGREGLQILNYADSTNIHVVGSFDGGGYAKDIMIQGDFVYLVASGLHVINVSDETNPYLHASIYTEYALGIDIKDNYIYIADELEGLVVISMPE